MTRRRRGKRRNTCSRCGERGVYYETSIHPNHKILGKGKMLLCRSCRAEMLLERKLKRLDDLKKRYPYINTEEFE